MTDKAATDAQAAANAAQSTANDALSKANTATSNIATIQTKLTATTSKTNATASQVNTLQTTVNGHTASIQTQQSSIDGLSAEYTVKVDVEGRISGFGLASSNNRSEFAVRADKFYITPPWGSSKGVSPFVVLANPTTINGVTVPAGTYIENAFIANGTLDIAKINKASIDSLSALSANIGHFKSAETGARLEIKDSVLEVYDSSGELRVRMGVW